MDKMKVGGVPARTNSGVKDPLFLGHKIALFCNRCSPASPMDRKYSDIFRHSHLPRMPGVRSGLGTRYSCRAMHAPSPSPPWQGEWLPRLRSLVGEINETFGRNFAEMAVAGEVLLGTGGWGVGDGGLGGRGVGEGVVYSFCHRRAHTDTCGCADERAEEFDKYGIQIKVKFR